MPEKLLRNNGATYPLAIATHLQHILFVHSLEHKKETKLFLSRNNGKLDFEKIDELKIFTETGKKERLRNCDAFHFFNFDHEHFVVYTHTIPHLLSSKTETIIAKSKNLEHFKIIHRLNGRISEKFKLVSNHRHKKNFLAYSGGETLSVAASSDLKNWHVTGDILPQKKNTLSSETLVVLDVLVTRRGLLVIYEIKDGTNEIKVKAALFSIDQPYTLLWKSEKPIWRKKMEKKDLPLRSLGCTLLNNSLHLYWATKQNNILIISLDPKIVTLKKSVTTSPLRRHAANPILEPNTGNLWENEASFNPAALHLDNEVHLIYRAIGNSGESCFGYASSNDGILFDTRLSHPVYAQEKRQSDSKKNLIYSPVLYPSGGSWGGYEDPRMVAIDDHVYVTFNLFDNWTLRVGFISIKKEDFLAKRFDKWDGPHILSHGNRDKNWVLFPEKIHGKFAVLHSIIGESNDAVRIEYIDDLKELSKRKFESPDPQKVRDKTIAWHTHVRSAGPPPLKTEKGWLLFYHANDEEGYKYKVGVMLLDLENPEKILARSPMPVLEPDFHYENNGKPGIVYASGAIVKDGKIHLYYGGADKVVCVATTDIDDLLREVTPKITRKKTSPSKKILKKNSPYARY